MGLWARAGLRLANSERGQGGLSLPARAGVALPRCTQQPWKAQAGTNSFTCRKHKSLSGNTTSSVFDFFFFFSLLSKIKP